MLPSRNSQRIEIPKTAKTATKFCFFFSKPESTTLFSKLFLPRTHKICDIKNFLVKFVIFVKFGI